MWLVSKERPRVAADDPGWSALAKEVYRAAQEELGDRSGGARERLTEIVREDLREALLDLKQAVLDGRAADAAQCMDEVALLLAELRRGSKDE
jgi:hypothetical protein